jgi:hypothetical protein
MPEAAVAAMSLVPRWGSARWIFNAPNGTPLFSDERT